AYTAVRLLVTGTNRSDDSSGAVGLANRYYPTFITGLTFGGGALLLLLAVRARVFPVRACSPMIALFVYAWLIHVPMAIQARYLVPVHLTWIALIAVSVVALMVKREQNSPGVVPAADQTARTSPLPSSE